MSDATAIVFILVASPLAGLAGLLLLGRPYDLIRAGARFSKWNLQLVGMRPDSAPLSWIYTPLHRRLLGDPKTLLDRACENPSQFQWIAVLLRADGIFLIAWSIIAAVAGVAELIQD
jgi:hypothetical protein